MESVEVVLPGGFESEGGWQHTVWLRPWCGADADFIGSAAQQSAVPAARSTALLGRCLSLDAGISWAGAELASRLTVGDREALMLHLHRITLGDRLSCMVLCPECHGNLDLDLHVSDLLVPPYDYEAASHTTTIEGVSSSAEVRFRLPNGSDQEAAARLATEDLDGASRLMLQRCIEEIDGAPPRYIPEEVARELPGMMAELDPQAEINLAACCPECKAAFQSVFDSAQFVHSEIDQSRGRLCREVHLLALHYHWSESDILAMSDRKRQMYLRLLSETLSRGAAR